MLNKFKTLLKLEFVYWVAISLFGAMVYGLIINFVLPKVGFAEVAGEKSSSQESTEGSSEESYESTEETQSESSEEDYSGQDSENFGEDQ